MAHDQTKPDVFRDRIATADESGKRIWLYVKKPSGRFHRARVLVAVFLLGFLFSAPFVHIGGNPLMRFDVIHREFFIFGIAFWPQDFHLIVIGILILLVFIVLFTLAFGRLFCGWICPQTVFLEMVFRKIEYLIEGDANAQRRLDNRPADADKILRKGLKHVIYLAISFLIGNTFLAYIIGSDALYAIITDPPTEHLTGLGFMLLFTFLFYGVFSRFREQACVLVCPYGRLQSVLLDRDSVVVAYDYKRGEPRGDKKHSGAGSGHGDCIDCFACVNVCPTGIDIRNGTQLECVNCTACIDACDEIMESMNRPRGLVRYASENNISQGVKFHVTPKMIFYSAALVLLLGLMATLVIFRTEVEATVLRASGETYEEVGEDLIRNIYTVKVINKTGVDKPVTLKLKYPPGGTLRLVGPALDAAPHGLAQSVFVVELSRFQIFAKSTQVIVDVYSGDRKLETIHTNFFGPEPKR